MYHQIWVETVSGEAIMAFTWTHDPLSGVERAKREAKAHGYSPVRVYAVPAVTRKGG